MHCDWPGNVREMENSIEHAFILCHGGLIGLRHLPPPLRDACTTGDGLPTGLTLAEIEDRVIREALGRNEGRKIATAAEAGISYKTTLGERSSGSEFSPLRVS